MDPTEPAYTMCVAQAQGVEYMINEIMYSRFCIGVYGIWKKRK